ncbi:MAG: hypothetical protein MI919_08420 [Holophagales bacterium]|nr:hypothetical protein [Holophagales bacterium]
MSYMTYKVLHLVGVFFLAFAVGGTILASLSTRSDLPAGARKLAAITHGIALVILLVTGFGALAKLGITGGIPGWVWAKLLIWLIFGASTVLIRKWKGSEKVLWIAFPLLATLSGWLALTKPF